MAEGRPAKISSLLLREFFDLLFIHHLPQIGVKNLLRRFLMKRFDLSTYGLVNKGDVVIHGGCFMIETVAKWSEAVGKKGKVIIIEASKKNVDILDYEIKRRYLKNVILINQGVWDSSGKMKFNFSEMSHKNKLKNKKLSSNILDNYKYDREETVNVDSIDNILKDLNIRKVDLVYFTISGAEREALRGMKKIIKNSSPKIWIRCSFYDVDTGRHTIQDCTAILRRLKYTVVWGRREGAHIGRNLFAYRN